MKVDPILKAVCSSLNGIGLDIEIDETKEFSKDPVLGAYPMRIKDKVSGTWIVVAPFGLDTAISRLFQVGFKPTAAKTIEVNRYGEVTALNGLDVLVLMCKNCHARLITTQLNHVCPTCLGENLSCVRIHYLPDFPNLAAPTGSIEPIPATPIPSPIPNSDQCEVGWLFDPKRAETCPLRFEPEWDSLRRRLSGKARVIPFPDRVALESLFGAYPNLVELRDHILGLVALRRYFKEGVHQLKPIMLVGPPACGKSSFVAAFANLWTGGNFGRVNFGQQTAHFTLTGSDNSLKRARQGMILDLLAGYEPQLGPVRNPMLVIDEIDKIAEQSQFDPVPSLLGLLESHDSRAFRDEYFSIPVDASGISYLAMANRTEGLPPALLSRFQVFHIRPFSEQEFLDVVIPRQYSAWTSQFHEGTFSETLTTDQALQVADAANWNPRAIWSALTHLAAHVPRVLSPSPTFESLGSTRGVE